MLWFSNLLAKSVVLMDDAFGFRLPKEEGILFYPFGNKSLLKFPRPLEGEGGGSLK